MSKEEFDEMVRQMKKQGMSEENIMDCLFETFARGDCDIDDLETMAGWMGYELDPEFKAEALKRQKKK